MDSTEMELLDSLKADMKGKENITIVLDAGHGGNDVGTGEEAFYEKNINLELVQKMRQMLEYCGVKVLLTREGDETVSLDERSDFANSSEADWFISVHCNFCEDDAAVQGVECYYWQSSETGRTFASGIIQSVESCGEIPSRGIKTEDFHVLRETKIPAVLIETGYLSNEKERENLQDQTYQNLLCTYLVKGIIDSL